jgi:hypothetical protein
MYCFIYSKAVSDLFCKDLGLMTLRGLPVTGVSSK